MTRLLLAVDGSELAQRAAQRGIELLGGRRQVTIAQVVRPIVPVVGASSISMAPAVPSVDDDSTEAANRVAMEQAEEEVAACAEQLGIEADLQVLTGDPGVELCRFAAEGLFDAIVVGSHGAGLLKRVLLGSVSHHVLHHAPCPVLVVRAANEERGDDEAQEAPVTPS